MFVQTTKVNTLNATCKQQDDVVADEEPLEIRLGFIQDAQRIHRNIAQTLRSPGQDNELGLGYLFTRNIIRDVGDIMAIDSPREGLLRIELNAGVRVDTARFLNPLQSVYEDQTREGPALTGNTFQIQAQHLGTLGKKLRLKQNLFHSTGGTHGCARFNELGGILEVAEDISRHNAMDKLLGRLLLSHALPLHKNGIIISGRASFGMMQKALQAQCPVLVAVGAPSSLAVELAREFNITLVGFLDQDNFNIYHDDERIIL